jgi:hypothetical protein
MSRWVIARWIIMSVVFPLDAAKDDLIAEWAFKSSEFFVGLGRRGWFPASVEEISPGDSAKLGLNGDQGKSVLPGFITVPESEVNFIQALVECTDGRHGEFFSLSGSNGVEAALFEFFPKLVGPIYQVHTTHLRVEPAFVCQESFMISESCMGESIHDVIALRSFGMKFSNDGLSLRDREYLFNIRI